MIGEKKPFAHRKKKTATQERVTGKVYLQIPTQESVHQSHKVRAQNQWR